MRLLALTKGGLNKIRSHHKELKVQDIEDSLRPISPGEWCGFHHSSLDEVWVGFVNPLIEEKYSCVQLVSSLKKTEFSSFVPEEFIESVLVKADLKRGTFKGYSEGCRLFYGSSDGLPGLIVDKFNKSAIIQINTAGVDRYRDFIHKVITKLVEGKSYFLDNPKFREKEFLPTFDNEPIPDLKIFENGLEYNLRSDVIQKVGFYYDHRENRLQLQNLLSRLNKKLENGVDLFCYAGAWGMNALASGISFVDFVDQGDFGTEIETALTANKFQGKGQYSRQDVFKFLDEAFSKNKKFDLVLCDPPAFAKSLSQKDQALEGYSKLHRKVFKVARSGSILCFSSCTHYVTHQDFQKNILDAAQRENKKIQLLYTGIQGWDHPISSLEDRSNYIKSYFYLME